MRQRESLIGVAWGARPKPGPASPANMSKRGLSARHYVPNQTLIMVNARLPKGNLAAGNQGRPGGYGGWNRSSSVAPKKAVVRPVASPLRAAASSGLLMGRGYGSGGRDNPPRVIARASDKRSIWCARHGLHYASLAEYADHSRGIAPAMTRLDMPSRSRGAMRPSFAIRSPSKTERAQGRPGARCTRGLMCKMHKANAHEHTGSAETLRPSLRNGFTAYIVLSPVTGYQIHTSWSRRVVPYLMRRKASRPRRITFGPGFP